MTHERASSAGASRFGAITVTLDRYGHLLPGNEHEAANLLDQWLTNADQGKPNKPIA